MKQLLTIVALATLPACASITKGSTQSILVETSPAGAECRLSNESGQWVANPTPQSVVVKKARGPITVSCTKGKLAGGASVESTTEAAAFGNILAGGIIGAAVDMGSGAAYNYPASVSVKLGRE